VHLEEIKVPRSRRRSSEGQGSACATRHRNKWQPEGMRDADELEERQGQRYSLASL